MIKKLLILTLLLCPLLLQVNAQDNQSLSIEKIISTPPSPPKLVNDYAGVLTSSQQAELETKVVAFDKRTSTQIAIVIVNSVEGRDIAEVGTGILRKWGVGGSKENNNGVVLLVAFADRKLNISTGYGLEKSLPDITCQQIIDYTIKPKFKGSDYYHGLDEGVNAIIQATQGEYTAPKGRYRDKGIDPGKIIFLIILIIILLSIFGGGGRGGSFMSRRGYRGFDGPFIFPTGGWSGGGGGGGGWSGGGGFGGFGGGSGGGGGASGSW